VARRKINRIDGQFNARLIEMLESPAYRVLSLSAHRVLDRVCIELAQHGGNDNGKLPVTYEHFMEYGIDRHAIAPAIRELEALGFLVVTQRGRPSAGEFRLPNLFLIPWINSRSSPNPVHDWRRIQDIETADALVRAARKQKSSGGNRHRTNGGNPHCNRKSPMGEIPTTVLALKTPTTSISPVVTPTDKAVSEARPSEGAVASARPMQTEEDAGLASALARLQSATTAAKIAS
jgi:hypothetical protein